MLPLSVDLHTHLRGTLTPDLVRELSQANKVYVPETLFEATGAGFVFSDFSSFLQAYDQLGAVVCCAKDLTRVATDYLRHCASEGTKYVEFMLSPDHSEANGIPLAVQLDAVQEGLEHAQRATGIQSCVVVTAVRHRGPTAAIRLAERLAELEHPVVRGFGLTGDERRFDVEEFAGAFYVARSIGLGCTAHVGEWGSARSVIEAVDALQLDRIGHGISVLDDPIITAELAERSIAFEVCLSSNHRLKGVKYEEHPLRALFDAGCAVTIATDDPAFFSTSPLREYDLAKQNLGFTVEELQTVTTNGINSAFCRDEVRLELSRLTGF